MVLLISTVIYLVFATIITVARPSALFDPSSGMPYGFGIANPNTRPFSFQAILQAFAVCSYFLVAVICIKLR